MHWDPGAVLTGFCVFTHAGLLVTLGLSLTGEETEPQGGGVSFLRSLSWWQVEVAVGPVCLQSPCSLGKAAPAGCGGATRGQQRGQLLTRQRPGSGFSLLELAASAASGRGLLPFGVTQACQED